MIDSHVHLFRDGEKGNVFYRGNSKQILQNLMDNLTIKLEEENIDKCLLYINDQDWFHTPYFDINIPKKIIIGAIVNPFWENIDEKLDLLLKKNIKILKLLPYEQVILREHYCNVLELARKIEDRNMVLTVCCSYGSKYVFDTNGVELVSYLLNHGIKSPIIMAHGGMAKIFEAMSLMMDYNNLYIDISFTLDYWWKSSVIDDYAFAIEKLNYDRIFYGSDYPYVSFCDSYEVFSKFCSMYKINDRDKEKILSINFEKFILDNIKQV